MLDKTTVFYDGLDHPECIAVHPDGSIWAGGEGGQIYRVAADGSSMEEITRIEGGFVLGIAFSPGADWLAICDLNNSCIWRFQVKNQHLSLFSKGAKNHSFKIPNYPVFDQAGNLYVSESGAFREVNGKILKFDRQGKGEVWHPGPFNFANGMALGPSRKNLFVVCSWLPGVEKISILEDGSAGIRSVYCTLPKTVPDGVAFDREGNLYVSCYAPNAIYKISPNQTVTELIEDWEAHTLSNPTNIAFGGPEFDRLFTANLGRWHISNIDIGVKGLPLVSHQNKK